MELSLALVIVLSLYHVALSQTITLSTDTSDNDYLQVEIGWGTPGQDFDVLVDTTDHTSWVYNASVSTNEDKFNPSESSTFELQSGTEMFAYQNETTQIHFARDTFRINDYPLRNQDFALATTNFTITDNEGLSGFLSLDRENTIISALKANGSIGNDSITIDVANNKLYFGPHIPSSSDVDSESNLTNCSATTNTDLNILWAFDMLLYVDDVQILPSNSFKGVIDSASPYITIYSKTLQSMEYLWRYIDKSSAIKETFNCNYTTRKCATSSIMSTFSVIVDETLYNVTIPREDVLSDGFIQFFYDGDTDYTTDTDYVLFLGRPFLKQIAVTLNYNANTMKFYALKSESEGLNWTTILIVFASVAVFTGLFFAAYCWKYGRIPPPTNHDSEEQVSLLRGPVQAVGSGPVPPVAPNSGMSGLSGLDEDEDEYQRQLQQVQRQSAIEAQQRREAQLREQREQQMMAEQRQQAQVQSAASLSVSNQRIGGSAPKPENPDDLRARRLKFLQDQEKKEQDE